MIIDTNNEYIEIDNLVFRRIDLIFESFDLGKKYTKEKEKNMHFINMATKYSVNLE